MQIVFPCPKCGTRLESEASAVGTRITCPQCEVILTVPEQGVGPGATIGGFLIRELLGKGGMGEVYLAKQLSMDRDVALKILPAALTSDSESVEQFVNEVRMAARLQHPNIVTAFEAGHDDGIHFLAMAYVKGEELSERLVRAGPLPEREALGIVVKVAEALAYAWDEHSMLHRDVKPDNIMIDVRGQVKLMDLGVSKILRGVDSDASDGTLLGTPSYMSPEQAAATGTLDGRSDMYALGATLYHMLTGRIPFESDDFEETLRRQSTESLPDPRTVVPTISDACVQLMTVMMARRPTDRHSSWAALKADLARVGSGKHPAAAMPAAGTSVLGYSAALKTAAEGKRRTLHISHDQAKQLQGKGAVAVPTPASRAGGKRRSVVPFVVVAVLVVAAVVGGVMFSRARNRDQRIRARTAALVAKYAEAEKYAGTHRADYDGAMRRFEEVVRAAAGTRWATKAKAEITRLAAARREAVRAATEALVRETGALVAQGEYEAALRRLKSSEGPFASEMVSTRQDLAREVAKAQRDAAAEAARRAAIEKEKSKPVPRLDFASLLTRLSDALLERDMTQAGEAVSNARRDVAFDEDIRRLEALGDRLGKLVAMPDRIRESFKDDSGKDVTVEFSTGPEKLRIRTVGEDVIEARAYLMSGGALAARDRHFAVEELSVRERFRRLGSERDADLDLMRGLLAVEAGQFDAAGKCFDRSDCPLGAALSQACARRLEAQRAAEEEEPSAGAGQEHAAARAYRALMASVGLSASESDMGKLAADIMAVRLDGARAEVVKRRVSEFRTRYADTQFAQEHGAVFEAFRRCLAGEVRVDRSALKEALAVLKSDNPGMANEPSVRVESSGIVLGLALNPGLRDISALRGLPIMELDLSNSSVEDLRVLKGMPLRSLNLSGCAELRKLDAVRGMALAFVCLKGCRSVTDIKALRDMPLTELDLSGCAIDDVRGLSGMALKKLVLRGCTELDDLGPLRDMPLEYLDISSTHVSDVKSLRGMSLMYLNMGYTRVGDLKPLSGMLLETLHAGPSPIDDIRPLKGMQLRTLSLRGTKVADLEPLEGMPLEFLDITGTRVNDLDPLDGMKSLTKLVR